MVPLDLLQLGRLHDALVLVYQLGALLPCLYIGNKTSVKTLLHTPKKYIYIKNLKNKN